MNLDQGLLRAAHMPCVLLAGICGFAAGLGASAARANEFPPVLNLNTLNGSTGFELFGSLIEPYAGTTISNAGDINGDGRDDVMIAVPTADPGGRNNAGKVYVVYGRSLGLPADLGLDTIDGSNGFVIEGEVEEGDFGGSAASAGDVNGDGIGDIIASAVDADTGSVDRPGASYVIFGSRSTFPSAMNVSSLDGKNGFRFVGHEPVMKLGQSVAGAGDVNGDGFDDVVIGAVYATRPGGFRQSCAIQKIAESNEPDWQERLCAMGQGFGRPHRNVGRWGR
jgi:FG-GAP repeat